MPIQPNVTGTVLKEIAGVVTRRVRTWARKALQLNALSGRGGWWTVIRESFTGAWQQNVEVRVDNVLTYFAVFACTTLIASDIGKLCLRLVQQDANGIWTETTSPSFSPVLRKPNHFQTLLQFLETWILSKLIHGNTYVLKQRDARRVVVKLYVLDPTRVTPLVATSGDVYYELKRDDLSGLGSETVTVPAREIIHDRWNCLFHPLIGLSPIFACGVAALQGLAIVAGSQKFFANMSRPGGILTAPGAISDETATRLKETWEASFGGDNMGRVAVVGDDLKYVPLSVNPADAQLIDQLKLTAQQVCSAFRVPAYMIGVGDPPPYANITPLIQQYYSQCLQTLTTALETCWDEGVGIADPINGTQYGVEFDINDLIWMDAATKIAAASEAIKGSSLSIDEARQTYLGVGPAKGGASIWMQNQNYSLEALAERDRQHPFAPKPTPGPPVPPTQKEKELTLDELEDCAREQYQKAA
ncbi:MAG TPA: phage portal protein [Gemmatimonadaceae bacterium]|nr:phage portal protein [Gemmatimonadaceae bacterium]